MSERSRNLPRRSCLSVPGSSEKMLGKAPNLGADMVFLDLEDAVAPLEKEAARDKVVKAINDLDWGDVVLCVRVNAWDTKWTYRDVIHVVENASERLDEIMLPKVQSAADVQALDMLLTQIEETTGRKSQVGIEPQIETARGLINVEEICAASPRLETIVFGPADFAASTEMPVLTGGVQIPEYPGDHFHYVFSKILMAGRANGLQVIDGPYLKIRELDALRDYAMRHAHPRLRRQVGAAPRPGEGHQRGVHAHPGAVRPRHRPPRGVREGDDRRRRRRAQGRGHVRRRDDRRGQPQDGDEVPAPGRAGRHDPQRRDELAGVAGRLAHGARARAE